MSPTQRSMKWARDNGYIVAKVEQRIPAPGLFITRDAFGFGDLLLAGGTEIALVQVTSTGNLSAREAKARTKCKKELRIWLLASGKFWLHGWSMKGARGKRKTWQLKQRELTLESLTAARQEG